MTAWVALSIDEALVIAVATTAELAKQAAQADCGPEELTWVATRGGGFDSTKWDYRVRQFEVIDHSDAVPS